MLNYIIRRLSLLIPVLIGVSFIAFSLMHIIPGDAAQSILGDAATESQIELLREELGLNDPYLVQYGSYLSDIIRGDLGTSLKSKESVLTELKNRLPATIELALFAILVAIIIGLIVGVISAVKKNSWIDQISMTGALFGLSFPVFWIGLMALWLFSVKLNLLPSSGRISEDVNLHIITNFYILDSVITGNFSALKDTIKHLLMPGLILSATPLAIIARMTKSSMLEVLKQDYIKTAHAKGLQNKYIIFRHALKNALLPVVTVIGIQFGFLLGGTVITETIFSWPGVGRYVYLSVLGRDYPVVQSVILIIATLFVLVNLITDILYKYINPKIKYN